MRRGRSSAGPKETAGFCLHSFFISAGAVGVQEPTCGTLQAEVLCQAP